MYKRLVTAGLGLMCCVASSFGLFFTDSGINLAKQASSEPARQINASNKSVDLGTDIRTVDSDITFSVTSSTRSSISQCYYYSISLADGDENSFVLGYYGEGSSYLPLTFIYNVSDESGNITEMSSQMDLFSSNKIYDAVGSGVAGKLSFVNYADFFIDEGLTVDTSSIKVANIFACTDNNLPDLTTKYYLTDPTFSAGAMTNHKFSDFLQIKFDSLASFMGYTSIECSYASSIESMYTKLYSKYSSHASAIAKGTEYFRFRFSSLTNSAYKVNFEDDTYYKKDIVGTTSITLSDAGEIKFLLNGFDTGEVKNFELLAPTISMEIMNTSTNKTVVGSAVSLRFSSILFDNPEQVRVTSFNLVMVLSSVIFLVLFAAGDYGYYRYKKEKYKNDEFNRVVPREFIKKNLTLFVYLELWLLEIVVLIGRTGALRNTMVVFNPFDGFIVVFSIILIIYTGYYIKHLTVAYKNYKAKKRDDALKINDTIDDDGTVITSKKDEAAIKKAK